MLAALLSGAAAGLAVALPIGAIGSYLIGLAAREKLGIAGAAALGVATVDGAYALLAAFGGVGLEPLLRRVSGPLGALAALVLMVLGVQTVRIAVRRYRHRVADPRSSQLSRSPRLRNPQRAYLTLMALTAINPATIITFAAVVLGRGGTAGTLTWWQVGAFALGAFLASALWQLLLVGGGSALGRVLRGPRGQFGLAVASAALMVGLAAGVLLS